jgi:hypothetical protein
MTGAKWDLGLPSISSPAVSGRRDGPQAVVPFLWRHRASHGSGHLTYRVVAGRLECVGLRVGDPGSTPTADMGTTPQPPLSAALFRALPMGAIIAAGARAVSEQDEAAKLIRAALEDSPEIVLERPDASFNASGRTPLPVHVIRAGARVGHPRDPRAGSLLDVLKTTDLAIEAPRRRPGRPVSYGPDHYQEIARIYAEAWRAGDRHPTATVAAKMHVVRSTAAKWVASARRLGLLGPTTPRRAGVRARTDR